MRNIKKTVYLPAEIEIIRLEQKDVLTVSSGFAPGQEPGIGPEDDPNVDDNW